MNVLLNRPAKGLFTLRVARKEIILSESSIRLLGIQSENKLMEYSAIEAEGIYFKYKTRWVGVCVGLRMLRNIKQEVHLEFKLKSKHRPEALFQLVASPSPDSGKHPSEIFAVLRNMDITLANSQQLILSNRRLEKVQEVGGLGYFIIHLEEGYWELSPVLANLLEFDELKNNDLYAWSGFIHPEHRQKTLALFESCMQNQSVFKTKYKAYRQKSKDYVWLEVAGEFEYLEDGKPKWMLGTAKDMSQIFETMDNLKVANRFLNETQTVARLGTFSFNFQQELYDTSKVLQEMLELDKGEIMRLKGWSEYVHPEDSNRVDSHFRTTIRNRDEKHEISYRIITKESRTVKWLDSKSEIQYSEEGEPLEMIGTVLDITERIETLKQLERQNTTLRDIAWDQSHLVRGPISRIQSLIIELEEEPAETESTFLIQEIKNSIYELDDIVRSVVQKTNSLKPIGQDSNNGFERKEGAKSSSTYLHIVDDDPIIRKLHTKMVQKINPSLKISSSKDGEEFIDFIELHQEGEHIVLLDINMPKLDGWEVLNYLANHPSHLSIKVIMVSSSTNNRDQQRALQNPLVGDYISKPLRLATVARILKVYK